MIGVARCMGGPTRLLLLTLAGCGGQANMSRGTGTAGGAPVAFVTTLGTDTVLVE